MYGVYLIGGVEHVGHMSGRGRGPPIVELQETHTLWRGFQQPNLENPRLWEVLAPEMYNPTPIRLAQIRARHRRPTWRLLGCGARRQLIGFIGLELGTDDRATIRNITVIPERRGEGIGRALIQQALRTFTLTQISAETDQTPGVLPCLRLRHQSLGEVSGTIRFLCAPIESAGKGNEDRGGCDDALAAPHRSLV